MSTVRLLLRLWFFSPALIYVRCSLGLGPASPERRQPSLSQEEGRSRIRVLPKYVLPHFTAFLLGFLTNTFHFPLPLSLPPVSANIITCATFAPTLTRAVLAHSEDPIFSNNHVHLAPLRETLSGVPLSAFPTGASTRLIPVTSADSHTAISEAEDSIIVVVDDATGVISVFRNSVVPVDGGGKLGKRRSSKAPSEG